MSAQPERTESDCEHLWYWRRRRNQNFGYWECVRCWVKSERIGLTPDGHAAEEPPEPGETRGG